MAVTFVLFTIALLHAVVLLAAASALASLLLCPSWQGKLPAPGTLSVSPFSVTTDQVTALAPLTSSTR
ncbi:hypothetical protein OG612_43560 (plasmid) [Streptomyces sp. NBC_01527]|uniref:hypothetical protein n=1 Tax=unclassified Streptomyces TaxID=2593676 RepID=UPI002E1353BC|nr:hypothetical protein OG763_44660 [Streptomyces sp. NBC_01230]